MNDNIITQDAAIAERLEMVSNSGGVGGFSVARMVIKDKATSLFYVLSEAMVPYSGQEILVFNGTEDGDITDWVEVTGGRGITFDEAITMLYNHITGADRWNPDW